MYTASSRDELGTQYIPPLGSVQIQCFFHEHSFVVTLTVTTPPSTCLLKFLLSLTPSADIGDKAIASCRKQDVNAVTLSPTD